MVVSREHRNQISAIIGDVHTMFVEDFNFKSVKQAEEAIEHLKDRMNKELSKLVPEDNMSIEALLEEED